MEFFKRVVRLIKELLNRGVDSIEKQIDVSNQIIRDMDAKIKKADDAMTDAMARLELIKDDERRAEADRTKWEEAALKAHTKGDIALANECAVKAQDFGNQERMFEEQITTMEANIQILDGQIEDCYARRIEAVNQVKMIQTEHTISNASMQVAQAITNLNVDDTMSDLGKIREKSRQQAAKASAMIKRNDKRSGADLEDRVKALDHDVSNDSALTKLLSRSVQQ